jgi:hypothetical protein
MKGNLLSVEERRKVVQELALFTGLSTDFVERTACESLTSTFPRSSCARVGAQWDVSIFGIEYTFSHLGLNQSLQKNVSMGYYEAGHMMYIHMSSLKKMKADLVKFIRSAM